MLAFLNLQKLIALDLINLLCSNFIQSFLILNKIHQIITKGSKNINQIGYFSHLCCLKFLKLINLVFFHLFINHASTL